MNARQFCGLGLTFVLVFAIAAAAQTPGPETSAATAPALTAATQPAPARAEAPLARAPRAAAKATTPAKVVPVHLPETDAGAERTHPGWNELWPDFRPPTLAWFAALVILALTIRVRPIVSLQTLDGLILAGMSICYVMRLDTYESVTGAHSGQWWAALLLAVGAAYWLVRGVTQLAARRPHRTDLLGAGGALVVLCAATLALDVHRLLTAPLSPGSAAGLVGGVALRDAGKLPYDEAPGADQYTPLVYLVHAPPVYLAGPIAGKGTLNEPADMNWPERAEWSRQWWEAGEFQAATMVNVVLFALVIGGLYMIGKLLHSAAAGLVLVTLFGVFPGTYESLNRPEAMLPAALLTWTVALAPLPGLGALLSTLLLVLAGFAWPWAWAGLPVLLAFFWRRGALAVVGSIVGALAGVALIAMLLVDLVEPSLPRRTARELAGIPAQYTARLSAEDNVVVRPREVPESQPGDVWTRPLWRQLLNRARVEIEPQAVAGVEWPDDIGAKPIDLHAIEAHGAAQSRLLTIYQETLREREPLTRLVAAIRTVAECTWNAGTQTAPVTPAWTVWSGETPTTAMVWTRRGVKIGVGLLAIWATLAIFIGRRTRGRHLVGGLLAVAVTGLVASAVGPSASWAIVLPLILALLASGEETVVAAVVATDGGPLVTPVAPAVGVLLPEPPRISNE